MKGTKDGTKLDTLVMLTFPSCNTIHIITSQISTTMYRKSS